MATETVPRPYCRSSRSAAGSVAKSATKTGICSAANDAIEVVPSRRNATPGMRTAVVQIVHFGSWPEWIGAFLRSCSTNTDFVWKLYGNCELDAATPQNVTLKILTPDELSDRCRDLLGISISPQTWIRNPYKLCDLKPCLAELFEEDVIGFRVFGFGDIDVIYGDLSAFCGSVPELHDAFGTHIWGMSGHFSLFVNEPRMRRQFRKAPRWREMLEQSEVARFDEDYFIESFMNEAERSQRVLYAPIENCVLDRGRICLREEFTTPLIPYPWIRGREHPTTWYWWNGRVYNCMDGPRDFIYLHFMNFKHARSLDPKYGSRAPWFGKEVAWHTCLNTEEGFALDFDGLRPLTGRERQVLAGYESLPRREREHRSFRKPAEELTGMRETKRMHSPGFESSSAA